MKERRTLMRNSSLALEELQDVGKGGTALDS